MNNRAPARKARYLSSPTEREWFSEYFSYNFTFDSDSLQMARDELVAVLNEKSNGRIILDASVKLLPTFSKLLHPFAKLLKLDLPSNAPNKLEKVLPEIVDQIRSLEKTEMLLAKVQETCRAKNRLFTSIDRYDLGGKQLWQYDFPTGLDDQIVAINAQLVHKKAISEHEPWLKTIADFQGEWLLTDFPPTMITDENLQFRGRVVGLTFAETPILFGQFMPFRVDVGWYPYARITGRFKGYVGNQNLPTLSVSTVEYRRPLPFQEKRKDLFSFIERETASRIYLSDRSNFQVASYMLPIISNLQSLKELSDDEQAVVSWYLDELGDKLPHSLKGWYGGTESRRSGTDEVGLSGSFRGRSVVHP